MMEQPKRPRMEAVPRGEDRGGVEAAGDGGRIHGDIDREADGVGSDYGASIGGGSNASAMARACGASARVDADGRGEARNNPYYAALLDMVPSAIVDVLRVNQVTAADVSAIGEAADAVVHFFDKELNTPINSFSAKKLLLGHKAWLVAPMASVTAVPVAAPGSAPRSTKARAARAGT